MHKKIFYIIIALNVIISAVTLESLSDGYKDIKLGMLQNDVKKIIENSRDFNIKKEEILSIRTEPDTEIISTEGNGFIDFAYFHFKHEKLFQIILKISNSKIGYYNLLKKFTTRFGNPTTLEPKRANWNNDNIKIVIEKPCTLKYLYLPIWNDLVKNDLSSDSILDEVRDKFIDQL